MPKLEKAKTIFWSLLNIALAVAIIVLLLTGNALWRYGKSVFPARVINVSAEGKAVVSPDVVNLSFSIVSEGKDPEKLQNDNNAKINAAINFVKEQGIDAKDIKTAGYNLVPRYEYDEKRRTSFISGYTLTQTVLIKVRDLNRVAKILSGLPERGINQIGALSFDIDDPDKFLNKARQDAFEKALAKAKSMASQNGVRIRRVINFGEFSGGFPPPIPLEAAALGRGGPAPVVQPSIEPGSQEVKVQVNVTYEIW